MVQFLRQCGTQAGPSRRAAKAVAETVDLFPDGEDEELTRAMEASLREYQDDRQQVTSSQV